MTSDLKLIIYVSNQTAELLQGDKVLKTYVVSTALNGLGCEEGSFQTPTGRLRVAEKIGEGCAPGTVFRGRVPTGEFWSADPDNALCDSADDLVLTRILWLEGCEPHNANTKDRYIYLHGTNQEHLLGQPVSHGCIRLSNGDVQDLFDRLPLGTPVEIIG